MDDRKDAERQAHVQRREEEAARPGRAHVDPFPLNVRRSLKKPGEEVDQGRLQAPTLPSDFTGMHVLYSVATLDVLLDKLRSTLAAMPDTPLVTLKQEAAKVCVVNMSCSECHRIGPYGSRAFHAIVQPPAP